MATDGWSCLPDWMSPPFWTPARLVNDRQHQLPARRGRQCLAFSSTRPQCRSLGGCRHICCAATPACHIAAAPRETSYGMPGRCWEARREQRRHWRDILSSRSPAIKTVENMKIIPLRYSVLFCSMPFNELSSIRQWRCCDVVASAAQRMAPYVGLLLEGRTAVHGHHGRSTPSSLNAYRPSAGWIAGNRKHFAPVGTVFRVE